jgi:dCTP diphosphatase
VDAATVEAIRRFVDERGWSRFHDPKNLAMALSGEAGELVAIFQWLTPDESEQVPDDEVLIARAREEIADVAIYLLLLADALGVDLTEAIREKLALNALRYPVDKAHANASKYTDLA